MGRPTATKQTLGLNNVANALQLVAASNLSDLNNAATARTNLGLGTAATHAATDFLQTIPISNTLYVDNSVGNDGSALRGRMDKPYLTVSAAAAAAQSGDVIRVGPGTCAQGKTVVNLPDNVHLDGAGMTATTITFTVDTSTGDPSNVLVRPGNNSVVSNLFIKSICAAGDYAFPIGFNLNAGDTLSTGVVLRNVKTYAWSDSLFFRNGGGNVTFSWQCFDCIFTGSFDCVQIGNQGGGSIAGNIDFFTCQFLATDDGTNLTSGKATNAMKFGGSGLIRCFGCYANANGGTSTGTAAAVFAFGGVTVELYGCDMISAGAAATYSIFIYDSISTVYVAPGCKYDKDKRGGTVSTYVNQIATLGSICGFTTLNPLDSTPANRPTGAIGQMIYSTGQSAYYVCTNAATPTWAQLGTGTVTSVGLSTPGMFGVASSPVTTAGTITLSLTTQNAGLMFAGPTTGASAAPTFRSLASSDMTALTLDNAISNGATASTLPTFNSGCYLGGTNVTNPVSNAVLQIKPSMTQSNSSNYCLAITPSWNGSGTQGSWDLLINRVTNVHGSGLAKFIDCQLNGVSQFNINASNGAVATNNVVNASNGFAMASTGTINANGGLLKLDSVATLQSDGSGNVNLVCASFSVNGTPVNVP